MSVQHTLLKRIGGHDDAGDTYLHGRLLIVARLAWIIVAVLSWSIYIVSLPVYFTQLQTVCTSAAACSIDGALTATGMQALHNLNFSVRNYAIYTVTLAIIVPLVWSFIGVIIFWRRSDDWMALLVSLFLLLFNTAGASGITSALALASSVWDIPIKFLYGLSTVCTMLFFFLFPDGKFAPRWMRWPMIVLLILQILSVVPGFASTSWSIWLSNLTILISLAIVLFTQIYRYRRVSTALQRQQTKWVVFGVTISLLGFMALTIGYLISPPSTQSGLFNLMNNTLYPLVFFPIPLSIGVATLRYRLYDIDVLINRTLVYGILTAALVLVYFGGVVGLEALLHNVTQSSDFAIVGSTLAIAAIFQPLRAQIQKFIDLRFYRRKYDATQTLAAFSATLRGEVDLNQLSDHLVSVVDETMQPTHVSLWLRAPQQNKKS